MSRLQWSFFVRDVARLSNALTRILAVVLWPTVALVAIYTFAEPVTRLIDDLKTLKVDPTGVSLDREKQVAKSLTQATAQNTPAESRPSAAEIAQKTATAAQIAAQQIPLTAANAKRILWVDNNPSRNQFERRAFEELGYTVISVTDTPTALEAVKTQRFDLIISDMGRGKEEEAGLDLLKKLRAAGNTTPLIFYTASATQPQRDKAIATGAIDRVNDPSTLVRLAVSTLK